MSEDIPIRTKFTQETQETIRHSVQALPNDLNGIFWSEQGVL